MIFWFELPPDKDLYGPDVETVGPSFDDLAEARAAIVGGSTWDVSMFERSPVLRVLARTGIGYDKVDLDEATTRGVVVCNTPDGPTVSTAEQTMMLILAVAKTVPAQQRRLREATGDYLRLTTAMELDGRTLGLLGYGRIGRRVARAAAALGMEVIAHDPFVRPGDLALGVGPEVVLVAFDELLARSDVLSLHAPLTPETDGVIGAAELAAMKSGAVLVNCARGGLVDHDALLEALERGHLLGAGLDVTEPEPLDPSHPLLHRDDVVITPHVASSPQISRQRMLDMAVERALIVLRGEPPVDVVNPAVLR